MNSNIFGLCRNESLLFEMIKEFDSNDNEEEQNFPRGQELTDLKDIEVIENENLQQNIA